MKLLPISFKVAFVFLIAINLNACKSTDIKTLLGEATSASLRSDQNKVRDPFRHPKQTLDFFGLKPNMTVVEIWPGSGWYSEILAAGFKEEGKF
jgi:predicted methyltransferase